MITGCCLSRIGSITRVQKEHARKIKPSESMQAGLPRQKTPLNFLPSDSGYNSDNYRNYKIKDNEIIELAKPEVAFVDTSNPDGAVIVIEFVK